MERKLKTEKILCVDLKTQLLNMAETCNTLQEINSELKLKVQSKENEVKDLEDESLFITEKTTSPQLEEQMEVSQCVGMARTVCTSNKTLTMYRC